ncbi:HXXEE domain-containing protein [Aminobacter anthyllidis]|uniref:HXXEE domain-containing protein n=1 Tax=Aminobacter anthyllidis TaxID=1035067 RepID=A0A9X1A975_9HYPH|nr:HXXEE domain-containing protein [Aminobacter anthyllidis]MBT1155564.1 HXXEE domain-containing protein [Aminobacter anthyllidis]
MNTTRLLFLLMVIGLVHMGEQLIFGVEELDLFKGPIADYYAALAGIGPDRATVILITIVVTLFTWMSYAMLAGGWQRLIALGLFGLLGANEGHHVIQAILDGGYDSGLITCIPYSATGILMLIEVVRESRALWRPAKPAVNPA